MDPMRHNLENLYATLHGDSDGIGDDDDYEEGSSEGGFGGGGGYSNYSSGFEDGDIVPYFYQQTLDDHQAKGRTFAKFLRDQLDAIAKKTQENSDSKNHVVVSSSR